MKTIIWILSRLAFLGLIMLCVIGLYYAIMGNL